MSSNAQLFRLNNLTGGINSISEDNALISIATPQNPNAQCEFRDIENFIPLNRGGQSKTFGYSLYQNTGSTAITGLYRFIQTGGNSYFIYSSGTKVYKLVSGTSTSIGTTIANGAYPSFCTAQNNLVICDGSSAPVFWNGSSITTIGNGAPTGAVASIFTQNRLWMFGGTSNPNLLYFSTADDITSGYNALSSFTFESVTGDTLTSNWNLIGISDANSTLSADSILYYFTVTTSGSNTIINIYQDSAGANLVATGSITTSSLPTTVSISQQNSSGISGTVHLTAGTETTVGNQLLTYSANNATGGFINCNSNDGQVITGITPFFVPGELAPCILVSKTRSVGIVFGDGSTGNPYYYVSVNFDFGVAGFRQFVQYGMKVAYLTPQGVATYDFSYLGVSQAQMVYQYLSEKVRNLFEALSNPYAHLSHCWHDWLNTRISFAVTEEGQSLPNVIWHFDYRLNCWYKERYSSGNYILCSLIDTDGTWYHGDSEGNIFIHSSSTYDFNGSPINAYITFPYLDFGNPNLRKQIVEARISVRGQGMYNLGIGYSMDYGDRIGPSNTIALTKVGYTWGGSVWTANPNTYQWGGQAIQNTRFFPQGLFRNIQPQITQSGADQPVDIFELEFTVQTMGVR